MPLTSPINRVVRMVEKASVLRPRDLPPSLPRQYLRMAFERGLIRRVGRGLYSPLGDGSENSTLAEVCTRIPHGIICLLSALRFHGLTTQAPFEVWLAIHVKTFRPNVPDLPLRLFYFSGAAFTEEVQTHRIDNTQVRVYSPAKTVADCFKYRNKIGVDVAIEALRDCWRQKKATMDQLWHAAKICRVANVMRPYLESLV
jgi:predicted transcriptional regulator of viral defense system